MDKLMRNLRLALRTLVRTPAFTLTVLLTFAIAIGANSAMLAVVDQVVLRPLSFPESDRLVRVQQVVEKPTMIAPARLADWQRESRSFEQLAGYFMEDVSDTTSAIPERVRSVVTTPEFFAVWRIAPALGRTFTTEEAMPGAAASVVISDAYWRARFGASPNAIGQTLRLEHRSYTVVGVMPASFRFPEQDAAVFRAYAGGGAAIEDRDLQWYVGIARMKAGVEPAQAMADLQRVQASLAQQYPGTDREVGVSLVPLKDTVVGGSAGSLWLLLGAVAMLLLIACTNVAALLLTRVAEREQQVTLRFALGATRAVVALQFLTESAVLAFAGAVLSVPIAIGVIALLHAWVPGLPRLQEVGFDFALFGYALLCALLVATVCGALPAWRGMRLAKPVAGAGRSSVGSRHRVQWALVGAQVALSVTLLVGAGLLLRSLDALSRVDPGFDPERLLVLRVSGNWSEETDKARLAQRLNRTLDGIAALPGVESAATAWQVPGVNAQYAVPFEVEGQGGDARAVSAEWRTVSSSYFATAGIPLAAGTACPSSPDAGASPALMVNEAFVARHLGGRTAMGLNLAWEGRTQSGRIAGVVGDAREIGMDREPMPTVYVCDVAPSPFPWMLVRAVGDPAALADAVRRRVSELEPMRSVYGMAPLTTRIGDSYAANRLRTLLLGAFAATALALTCLGVQGTLGYVVSLRRREIGLRMALGAAAASTVRHFLGKALRVVAIAALVGLLLSLAATRGLAGMLYGVLPWDPLTFAAVTALVLLVAGIAALLPALRAARIEPMKALREG